MTNDKFEYFMQRTREDFAEVKLLIHMQGKKLDNLWNFKMKLAGAVAVLSFIVSISTQLLTTLIRGDQRPTSHSQSSGSSTTR